MAQEILVKDPLEEKMIEAGKELLQRLAKTDFKYLCDGHGEAVHQGVA